MRTCFYGDWLFDGEAIKQNYAFIVENDRIVWMGIKEQKKTQLFDKEVNLSGKFVTPGFIDAHVHIVSSGMDKPVKSERDKAYMTAEGVGNAEALLACGIVACRDLGSVSGMALGIRDAIEKGHILGPHIVAAGRSICVTGGHGYHISIECDGADAVAKGVRTTIKEGADVVKLMVSGGVNSPGPEPAPCELTKEEIETGVITAHAWGRKVAVHTHGNTAIKRCVAAGADSIEHGVYLTEDIMHTMLEKGTYLVPTFSAPFHAVNQGIKNEPDNADHAKSKAVLQMHRDTAIKAFNMGVNLAMGSDAGTPYNDHNGAIYELMLMGKAGFMPLDILRIATKNAANLLGIDADYGMLSKGKFASFLCFNTNPTKDIETVTKEKKIYIKGEVKLI